MIIWILALVLVLAFGAIGYTFGAVRMGISTLGVLVGAVFCMPLSPYLYSTIEKLGGTRAHAFYIAPLLVLAAIAVAFKVLAGVAHKKIDSYYRYRTADFVQTLWERTNARFGAVLGVLNALVYVFLLSTIAYIVAYPVSQLSSGEEDSTAWRWLMKTSEALRQTKMNKAVQAFNPAPAAYYNICDVFGMVYQNPMVIGRLTSYPPIMALGEREEFRARFDDMAKDTTLSKKLMNRPRAPFQEILGHEQVHSLITNKHFMAEIYKLDFNDLSNYLATGSSPKFANETILGRWRYNAEASSGAQLKAKPDLTRVEKWRLVRGYSIIPSRTAIVGMMNNQISLTSTGPAPTRTESTVKGTYNNAGEGKYDVTWAEAGPWGGSVEVQGDQLKTTFKAPSDRDARIVIFDKE